MGILVRRGEKATGEEGSRLSSVGTSPAGRRRSVILVDDDLHAIEMYRLGLEMVGFAVTVAGDGAELFAAVEEAGLPDLVVLDWDLPGERGDAVLRRLREDYRAAFLPVFILSNFPASQDGHVDLVFEAGALAWLEKVKTPPHILAKRLNEALGVPHPR